MISHDENGRVSFGRFDFIIQGLIILSLISFALETLPNLTSQHQGWLRAFEIGTVVLFTVEYLLRLCLSRPRGFYAWSFFGIVDLIAILPFYVATGIDLRSVRAFRLLRLFRLLKLARYSSAMQRYHRAFMIAREELILFGFTALIMFYLASVGIYYFENQAQPETFASVFHSFWWAVATLTTVGYGDIYPITVGGKIFTFIVLMIGLGFVAVPTGLFASALSAAREEMKQGTQSND
ncbi:ion transporter [Verrucomicrobiaceae bacterium R5-34]|uniref:Ion transporter n=1 Tax=Oceaniferula flava TaxID=2800421 RepID=A0AAE2V8Y4_9BACT|nr:ion transporter [Oceaniferula flavus]MBK1832363.1 ion transporter [Verrucomicrobiaceae bacterium R5-34]MBK1856212.1 ion transporter [Oceaniferula flavus]MBM1137519.1 ion transporter [Oceaniferula flavus]